MSLVHIGVGAWVAVAVLETGALVVDAADVDVAELLGAAGELDVTDVVPGVVAPCVPVPDVELVQPASAAHAASARPVSCAVRRAMASLSP